MPASQYINALREDNSQVIEEIIRKFLPKIKSFIIRNSGNIIDGEEFFYIGLEVLATKALTDSAFQLPDDKFYAYLKQTCFNKWMYSLRTRKKIPSIDIIPDLPEFDIEFEVEEESQLLFNARKKIFNQLKEDCRKDLMMFYGLGMSDKEIAEEKGGQVNSVRVQRHRCLKYLKNLRKK